MEIAMRFIGGTNTVRLGTLPDIALKEQASAPAAGTASAVGVGCDAGLFQRNHNRIRCLGIDDLFINTELNGNLEVSFSCPLG